MHSCRTQFHLTDRTPVRFSVRGPRVLVSRRPAAVCRSVGQIAGARSCLGKVKISIARARADPVRMQSLRRRRHAGAPRRRRLRLITSARYNDNRKSSPRRPTTVRFRHESRIRSIPIIPARCPRASK